MPFGLSTVAIKAIAIGLLVLALIAGLALFTAHEQSLGAADERAKTADAAMKMAQDSAAKSAELAATQQKVSNDAQLQASADRAAAASATRELDAARVQLNAYLRRRAVPGDSSASSGGQATTYSDDLLAGLLDASWQRNLDLAAIADARGTAGTACERWSDSLTTKAAK